MNTIYSLIHKRLKRILALSAAAAGAALIIYSFLSWKQTEDQAMRFVTSHVAAIAQAGVNSQNVNEIDKEIARFTQTWKETQDLDLRVNIFLDEKLVAHAGQLRSFQFLSSRSERNIRLPSGETLSIKVEIGLERFLILGALLFSVFAVFILAVFRLLTTSMRNSIRTITSPIEERVNWIKKVSETLPLSASEKESFPITTEIRELDDLSEAIGALLNQISKQEEQLAKISYDRGRVKMAEQVAHSIKGVISTLQLKMSLLQTKEEQRELGSVVGLLKEISSNLLKPTAESGKDLVPIHVLPAVQTTVAAKVRQYGDRHIKIWIEDETPLMASFSTLHNGSLQTMLSSLIDNSAEAMEPNGHIKVSAQKRSNILELVVHDDGKGVPQHILPLLMKEGATFGKPGGHGIGLSHAKELLGRVGGSIQIESAEGNGTRVRLLIPLLDPPKGFLDHLEIPNSSKIIMLDDDPLIHQSMDIKIKSQIVHLFSVQEFETWIEKNGLGKFGERLYFFDHDLKDKTATGLDLIERHGLAFESILISGMTDNPEVRNSIQRLGLRWIPKEFLAQVPFILREKDGFPPYNERRKRKEKQA